MVDSDSDPGPATDAADRSPEAIRDRYARYQRGRRQGSTGEPPAAAGASSAGAAVPGGATPADPESGISPDGAPAEAPTTESGGLAAPQSSTSDSADHGGDAGSRPGSGVAGAVGVAGAASAGAVVSGAALADAGSSDRSTTDASDGSGPATPAGRDTPEDDAPTAALPVVPAGDEAPGRSTPSDTGDPDPTATPAPATGTDPGVVPAPDVPWGAGPVREPTAAGSTTSGLPLRAPGANYVPGAVPDASGGTGPQDGTGAAAPEQDGGRPEWDRSAEAIRRRFAAHQEGRRRGMERTGR